MLNKEDLFEIFESLGLKGVDVYLTGSFRGLTLERMTNDRPYEFFISCLQEYIGVDRSIVVPSHSYHLIKSDTPFSITTKSDFPFANYIISNLRYSRIIHPFHSLLEIGTKERFISTRLQRNIYAHNSVFDVFATERARHVSIGQKARTNMAAMHKAEANNLVPYRYNKGFMHPVVIDREVKIEEFFMYSLYQNTYIERDNNEKVFRDSEILADLKAVRQTEFFSNPLVLMWLSRELQS